MNRDSGSPTIAVVVPNRNDSAFLAVCLDSILGQKVRPDQIIFVDDQSTDDSLKKARAKLKDIPGAIVLANAICLGTMGALNEGLRHATCDYVLFLASNDHLLDGIIENAKSSIRGFGQPGVWSAMVWAADKEGRCKYVYPSPVIALKDRYFDPEECRHLATRLGNWFTGTTLIYNRKSLLDIGGFDAEYRGLADLFAALTIASQKGAVFCPRPLGVMRMHSGGYLWRTLTDLDDLEAILVKIEARGQRLSPELFSRQFCHRTKCRIRFAALRALRFEGGPSHSNWLGMRYRLLQSIELLLGTQARLMTFFAFAVLRPFDMAPFIRYRVLGAIWSVTQNWKRYRHRVARLEMEA